MAPDDATAELDAAAIDPTDAELIARAEAGEGDDGELQEAKGNPSPAPSVQTPAPAPEPTTAPDGEAPPAGPASLRRAAKIVIRLGSADDVGRRAAHVFVQVDGAEPVCAVCVAPSAGALQAAVTGLPDEVERLLAHPPRAALAPRSTAHAAGVKAGAPPAAAAPRVCTVCKGTFPKGGLKAHQQEPRHREAELAAAATAARTAAAPLATGPAAPPSGASPTPTPEERPVPTAPLQASLFG